VEKILSQSLAGVGPVISQASMEGLQQPSAVLDQINVTPTHRQVRVQQQQQRWIPSQNQLQILKNLYEQGNGTPNKQRLREITTELIQHGHVQETNVYNWFRNRKAYVKRRQQVTVSIRPLEPFKD
jgi:hypothetical protein